MKQLLAILMVLLLLVGLPPGQLLAQSGAADYETEVIEQRTFDQSNWENLSSDLDYSGKPPKPKKKPETPDEPEPYDPPSFPELPDLSPLFKALLFILVIGALASLIYAFVNRNELSFATNTDEEPDEEEDLSNISRLEEELDKRNVDPYLLKAEKEGNYHLAVRLHFLALLKQLHEQELIQWKKDRTNRVYLNQLRGQTHYPQFRQLTLTFERVWYGDYHPAKTEYEQIKVQFSAYRETIKNTVAV